MPGPEADARGAYAAGPSPDASGELTLFCLPYAGGSAAVYRCWDQLLPPGIVIHPVELPGRGSRFGEPVIDQLEPLVDVLLKTFEAQADRPFAIFGHSMGALLGFELARALRLRHRRPPTHLFVSGCRAPQIGRRKQPRHRLSDSELIDELHRLNGTPAELLANDELIELLLPILRADIEICDTYLYREQPPLACPIVAFGGTQDEQVPEHDIAGWRSQTLAAFEMRMLPGDHFFLNGSRPLLLRAIVHHLGSAARRPA